MRRFASVALASLSTFAVQSFAYDDCNGNGQDDGLDVSTNSSADLNGDGVPDECQRCGVYESARIALPNPAAGDRFGHSVALSGNTAVYGAPYRDTASGDSGAAFVYAMESGVWSLVAELRASDGQSFDHFGHSVALSGDVAVVGAPDDDNGASNSGSVYVHRFDGTTWNFEVKLSPSDPQFNGRFGDAVRVDGDLLLVGALGVDGLSGAVYAFRYDGVTWNPLARLVSSDRAAGDRFGQFIDLHGDVALLAAPQDDDNGSNSGSAYVFRFSNGAWTEEAKLRASDAAATDAFGSAVSVRGDRAVIGSPNDDDGGSNSGSMYVFERSGGVWSQSAKVTAFDRAAGDSFGKAAALDGNALVVSATGDDDRGSGSGSVYVYQRGVNGWRVTAKFNPSAAQAGDFMGPALALEGGVALVSAWEDADAGFASGVAYTLHSLGDCSGDGRLDLCELQLDANADSNFNSIPDACDPDCNANDVPDDLDFATGASVDCDGNGLPDECDIQSGASVDCNANGVPDGCDVESGASLDCDVNGVPDECDADTDADGVIDGCDQCPSTPAAAAVDADGCPLVPPMVDLTLDGPCSERPGEQRRWRVGNPNAFVVAVSWSVRNTGQFGGFDAPPGESDFVTETIDGLNVAELKWSNPALGNRSTSATSSGEACPGVDSDADGVPDAADWCPQTPAGTEADEHGCGADQHVALCHTPPGNREKRHTIHVAPSEVRSHLRHGDALGPCESPVDDGEDEKHDGKHDDADHDDKRDDSDARDGKHGKRGDNDEHAEDGDSEDDLKEEADDSESSNDRDEKTRDANDVLDKLDEFVNGKPIDACGAGAVSMLPLAVAGFAAGKVRTTRRRRAKTSD